MIQAFIAFIEGKRILMRKTRMFGVAVTAFSMGAVAVLGFATSASAAGSGNGTCASTELCVYRLYDRHASDGYFDLGSPDVNFTNGNNNWYNHGGNINDAISSYTAGTGTSCDGYSLFWNKDMSGIQMDIPKGWGGNLAGAYANFNDEFSSYSKFGC
ncbi:hypothetical protein [Streptomyces sp. NPDC005244]|uniref:hypothetical protein n=1 Tax=Streptomyces sp. NPDC005244 TaxID=3364708 RepID=UPI00367A139B